MAGDEIRQNVIQSLPELKEIKAESLRHQVIEAWTYSLSHSSLSRSTRSDPLAIRTHRDSSQEHKPTISEALPD